MISILKTFGLGLLCTILSPLILLILVCYFIYTLTGIIVMFCINIYRYFATGGSVLDELKIDKQAKQILNAQEEYDQKLRESILNGANPYNAQQTNPFNTSNLFNATQENSSINLNTQTQYSENTYQNYDQTSQDNYNYGGDNQ